MSFNPEPFWQAELAVQIHALCAIFAFFVGVFIFSRRKGSSLHRLLGRVWVALMFVVAFSSLFIHGLRTWGPFSPIHLLTVFTFLSLVHAIWAAKTGRITAHQQTMLGLFFGGLVVAGLLAFSRGLLLNKMFFSSGVDSVIPSPAQWPGGTYGFVFVLFVLVFIVVSLVRPGKRT